MIFILSEEKDETTNDVIDWLVFQRKSFIRVNMEDTIKPIYLDTKRFIIEARGKTIDSDDITSFWYRRGPLRAAVNFSGLRELSVFADMKKHMSFEMESVMHNIYRILAQKKCLTTDATTGVDKLEVLDKAEQLGILVPPTLITSRKQDLMRFFKAHQKIICKPLNFPFTLNKNGHYHMTYTEQLTQEHLDPLPDQFFPSLFQKMVEKTYEIRAFYIQKAFYSMAIFSQQSTQTAVDFRKYNWEKPNRTLRYQLPPAIEEKLTELAHAFHLKTGSFDLMVDKEGNYHFLEVNPIGQFGMVSFPCNYYLENIVAEFL